MLSGYLLGQSLVLLPVVGGSLYGLLGVVTAVVFCARQRELTAGQLEFQLTRAGKIVPRQPD
jgi:hypothetical protein